MHIDSVEESTRKEEERAKEQTAPYYRRARMVALQRDEIWFNLAKCEKEVKEARLSASGVRAANEVIANLAVLSPERTAIAEDKALQEALATELDRQNARQQRYLEQKMRSYEEALKANRKSKIDIKAEKRKAEERRDRILDLSLIHI